MNKWILGVLLTAMTMTGCALKPSPDNARFKSYNDFRAGPEGGVDLIWSREDITSKDELESILKRYDSVVLDRIYVVVEESELSDDEITLLTEHLKTKLSEKLSSYKRIVDTPSDSTLRISIAISNIETPNPVLAVTSSILPVGLGISTISKITTGEHTNVGKATIELMVSDSITDDPIIAVIDRRSGNKDMSTMIDSLDDAKDVINWWVERLGVTLESTQ
ncbi:hypothetical protein BCU70_19280 [Vibrio sp. 10N.286.49.C2]|uniref:DUF3313 domain-containing protein n=1 Tax=unclassified Vibrio TaxID=2614977 RepID=UPI000C8233E9|nr:MULTISPECIES: DUF3313 domain-containing protein [unclassified Vibrio]PMH34808.1 hypothetical protein BCU70_19280 [Vibrio sp. 10N.286.49.C2]PMH51404.1 hypothetical protein BCU66_16835 [Vibrio sp. 10N.286.49.B1]PMH81811.1 hypothetical protein BCU58_20325 [Vibrio sp. 10N.286.48.B7]